MIQPIQPGPASGTLLLADTSGYTGFLQAVAAAYALITEAAASRLAVPAGGAREFTETYEHYSPIAARVYALR